MKKVSEKIIKKSNGKFIRRMIQEEDVDLTLEEIERMERNADRQIELSRQIIEEMEEKKEHCKELRLLI
ncbi:MAG: hypothetical protein ACD_5C00016G0014 [uncultured bacterium]|nr:MAG: hypothetical protein ACD_5C00016G0014 [uncultured bacterium]